MDRIGFFLGLLFHVNILILLGWDLFVEVYHLPGEYTVSYYVSDWFRRFPVLVLLVGLLLGHLIWGANGHKR